MPLTMMNVGEIKAIKKVGGNQEVRSFLEKLGFVVGENVMIVSMISGNVIVMIKESRIAISREMANKIMV